MLPLCAPLVALADARAIELRYEVSLDAPPAGARDVRLWIPLAEDDASQTVRSLRVEGADGAVVVHDERYGNAALYARPRGAAKVAVTYVIERREERRDVAGTVTPPPAPAPAVDGVVLARWLCPDRLGALTPTVRDYAARATAGRKTPLTKARAIYDFVFDTMRYDRSGEGWGRGDIVWVCDAKRGNCTDFHTLFVAMARASGIPARFEIGLPLPAERGQGEIPGYHCWARLWLDGVGWVPVDVSEAKKHAEKKDYFFGSHDANRVQFSVGRDLRFPGMKGELNYFIKPYAEADGAPIPVAAKFFYRDLAR